MDTAGVGKGIAAHDSLVGLNGHIHQRAHHTARGINLSGIDIGLDAQSLVALQYHGNLLERRVTGTLTDTVDGHLYLTGTSHHTIEGVGSSHTQVVMTVSRDNSLINVLHVLHQIFDFLIILLRQTITCCVRDIHYCSTGGNHCLNDTGKILVIGTSGILAIELYVLNVFLGILGGTYGTLDNLLTVGIEFILDMRIARSDTRMNTLVLGIYQRFVSHIDILLNGTRQRTDSGPSHSFRNFNYRIEIAWTRNGESCFNHVNTQLLERLSHLNLLNCIQLTSRHLFAVAKCCVKNKQSVTHNLCILSFYYFFLKTKQALRTRK